MNDELRQLTAKNLRLQEAYEALKEQLANPAPTSQVCFAETASQVLFIKIVH